MSRPPSVSSPTSLSQRAAIRMTIVQSFNSSRVCRDGKSITPRPRQAEILPVVRYSAWRKTVKAADYWDHATLLELSVLARDEDDANDRLSEALAVARAPWELETTARNLSLIREMREIRGEDAAWINRIEDKLNDHAQRIVDHKA